MSNEPISSCILCGFVCAGEWLRGCNCAEAKQEANAARIEETYRNCDRCNWHGKYSELQIRVIDGDSLTGLVCAGCAVSLDAAICEHCGGDLVDGSGCRVCDPDPADELHAAMCIEVWD